MTQQKTQSTVYSDTKTHVTFGERGPQPQFLVDEKEFKAILGGLEPGQQIPMHPESLAMYHFLSGTGTMTVDDEQYQVVAGTTVITAAGARRGMQAETQLVFLAAKSA